MFSNRSLLHLGFVFAKKVRKDGATDKANSSRSSLGNPRVHPTERTVDIISSAWSCARVFMVVMQLWSHTHRSRLTWGRSSREAKDRVWDASACGARRSSYLSGRSRNLPLSRLDLCLSPDAPAPEPRVLIAVTPAVNSTLNKAPLSTQTGVQLSQSPTDSIALSLVVQSIALVLILWTASSRVNTILGPEILGQFLHVNRLDVAADGVLHLDPVSGILKRNPLNAVVILSHDKRGSCWYGTRRCVWVDILRSRSPSVHLSVLWCSRRPLLRGGHSRLGSLVACIRRELGSRTLRHGRCRGVSRLRLYTLPCLMLHHHTRTLRHLAMMLLLRL